MVNWTGSGAGQASLTVNVIVSQVLAPGSRMSTTWPARACGSAPQVVQSQLTWVSPPSGSTALADSRVTGTMDRLVTSTPSASCRPLCTEHAPMSWSSASESKYGNVVAGPSEGDAVALGRTGAGRPATRSGRIPPPRPAANPAARPTTSAVA